MRAVIVAVGGTYDDAEQVARIIGAALTMNGYDPGSPTVIEWPTRTAVRSLSDSALSDVIKSTRPSSRKESD